VIGADTWVLQTGVRDGVGEVSTIWSEARRAVERVPGVAAAGEVVFHYASLDEGERRRRVRLVGYEPGRPGGPSEIIAGRGITAPRREIVLDRGARIPVGAEVAMLGMPFTVVGHSAHALGPSGEPVAFVTLEDARRLQNRLSDPILRRLLAAGEPVSDFRKASILAVMLDPDAAALPVTAAIERWGGLSATTRQEQEEVYALASIEEISAIMALFALVLVVVTVAILSLTIHGMTMEKMRSIATLTLIGIPGCVIAGLVVQQAVMIGLVG
jgi:putative ABC transport system permease protein